MAKLPSFQFYPGDWLKDPDLRICSVFARGLLVDLLCMMFEANRRGVLEKKNGKPWTPKDVHLAIGTGSTLEQVEDAMMELEENGVLKREESTGCLYSARMVRDEGIRQERKLAGSKGGAKTQANNQAKREQSEQQNSTPSSSSSSSSSEEKKEIPPVSPKKSPSDDFLAAWDRYPKRAGGNSRADAWRAWQARLSAGVAAGDMTDGTERYRAYCDATGKTGTEYVKQAATFFGPAEHFRETWEIPDAPRQRDDRSRAQQHQDKLREIAERSLAEEQRRQAETGGPG